MSDIGPGAATVGAMEGLPAWEAQLILSLRLWMGGQDGQAELWTHFASCFGPQQGRARLRCFEELLTGLCTYSRRPLNCRVPKCRCIGADEAVLQTMVREATRGDIAEAAMIASLILPVGQAELVALRAADVGRAMQLLATGHATPPARPMKPIARPPDGRLH